MTIEQKSTAFVLAVLLLGSVAAFVVFGGAGRYRVVGGGHGTVYVVDRYTGAAEQCLDGSLGRIGAKERLNIAIQNGDTAAKEYWTQQIRNGGAAPGNCQPLKRQ